MDGRAIIELLAERLPRPSRRGLEQTLEQLIAEGTIPVGTRLPTIREVAVALDLSSSAVGMAWRALVQRQAIRTGTKGGSTVLGPPQALRPLRYLRNMSEVPTRVLDLGVPIADPALLPPIRKAVLAAMATIAARERAGQQEVVRITPELEAAVRPGWPYAAAAFLATHRPIEGVGIALHALVRRGDAVAVEDPTTPRVIDNLEAMGARILPVPWEEHGPDLRYLRYALRTASVFLYQPFAQTPTGRSVDPEWLLQAAALLHHRGATAIELVHTPFLADGAVPTLGTAIPGQTLHIHGYSMSHGDDVRAAVVSGPEHLIGQLSSSAAFTSQWVSPLLQTALAHLLEDPVARRRVAAASVEYRRRVGVVVSELRRVGFAVEQHDGLRVRVPVGDEHAVQDELHRRGYHVHLGSSGVLRKDGSEHIVLNGAARIPDPRDFAVALAAADALISPVSATVAR